MNTPTALLVPLLAVVLLVATLLIVRLCRGLAHGRQSEALERDDPDRVALLERRERLLTMLGDLELEHATGKVSPQDYVDLKQYYEREALQVMSELGER
jgi:hypothetical protein